MTPTNPDSHQEKVMALQASVFSALTAAQLEDVARISEICDFPAGTELCLQGACAQESFVLAHGNVAVEVDGTEVVRQGPGAIVGDWAMFGDGRRTATIRALSAVQAIVIDARELDSLLMAVPQAIHFVGPKNEVVTS